MSTRMVLLMVFAAGCALRSCQASDPLTNHWTAMYGDLKNPYEGDRQAVLAGAKLYRRHCASCHGAEGEGIDRIPGLRSKTVREAAPGALFGVLKHGIQRRGMPSWSGLPEQRRWQIISYLQSTDLQLR